MPYALPDEVVYGIPELSIKIERSNITNSQLGGNRRLVPER